MEFQSGAASFLALVASPLARLPAACWPVERAWPPRQARLPLVWSAQVAYRLSASADAFHALVSAAVSRWCSGSLSTCISPSRRTRSFRCLAASRRSEAAWSSDSHFWMLATERMTAARLLLLSARSLSRATACSRTGSTDGEGEGFSSAGAEAETFSGSPDFLSSSPPPLSSAPAPRPRTGRSPTKPSGTAQSRVCMSRSTRSAALRAAISTGSQTGENGGA